MAPQNTATHTPPSPDAAAFWRRRAARVQRKVNCSWWLQAFCPVFLGVSLASSVALLLERYLYAHSHYGWSGFSIATAIAMLLCLWWTKPKFYRRRDGLVHLEAALRLHNRLSAAYANVGPWPPAQTAPDGLRWRWPRLAQPLIIAVMALNLAAWLPLRPPPPPVPSPTQPPLAWERMETALDTLEQSDLLQGKSIETFREPLMQLQQQPSEQWYTHHTLEASDMLRAQLEHTLDGLEHHLQQMASSLDALSQSSEANAESRAQLRDSFNQTRDQLALGRLPLNNQALDTLNQIDRDSLQGLSQEQLSALKEQLRQGTATIRDAKRLSRYGHQTPPAEYETGMVCPFDGPGRDDCALLLQPGANRQTDRAGMSGLGEAGQGGVTRGPGSAPLALDPRPQQTRAGRIEVIQGVDAAEESDDYRRRFVRSAPQVDRSQGHALSSGGMASEPVSRDATVWRHQFTPDERDVLKHFFK